MSSMLSAGLEWRASLWKQNEEREVGRLAEVGKIVLEEAAYDLIRTAHKRPVLFDYCGDGTPLKLKSAFHVGLVAPLNPT